MKDIEQFLSLMKAKYNDTQDCLERLILKYRELEIEFETLLTKVREYIKNNE